MNKFLSLALTLVLVTLVAGCGSTATGTATLSETDAAMPQADAAIVDTGNIVEDTGNDAGQPDASDASGTEDVVPDVPVDVAVTTIVTQPAQTISLAGIRYGLWYNGQTFTINPGGEALRVERVRVRLIGNSRCVDRVAIVLPPDVLTPIVGGVFPASVGSDPPNSWVDLTLPVPVSIPPSGGRTLAVAIQWARPVDPAIDPAGCHPGDLVQIGLGQRTIEGAWDPTYTDSFNVRMVGADSGEVVRASAPLVQAMNTFRMGIELTLGQPVLELATPSSLELVAGTHEVRYTLRSTGLPIAVKKVEVFFRGGNADGATPWYRRWSRPFEGTRFLRDGVVVDPSTYNLVPWTFSMAPGESSITVEWITEEEVTREGHSYTLIVPLAGTFESGDTLQVRVGTGWAGSPLRRGRLTPLGSNFGLYHVPGPHVWTGMGRCILEEIVRDGNVATSSFVWSDRSSVTHSWADCSTTEGSDDWFTRAEVPTGGTYTLTP